MLRRTQPRREARPSRLSDDERGSVAITLILIPLALFVVMGSIHLALLLHGRNVAAAAAQDGLHAAAQFGATEANGYEAAERTLDLFAGIENRQVDVIKDDTTYVVTVTVSGTVTTPVAGLANTFEITVTGPAERFYEEDERG